MKKALSVILAAACMMNFTACGDDDNGGGSKSKSSSSSEEQSIEDCIVRVKDYRISIFRHRKSVIIQYEFYNNQDKEKSFDDMFSTHVYQNDVECVDKVLAGAQEFNDSISAVKNIMPGDTCNVIMAYYISDDSDIHVKVTDKENENVTYIDETFSLEDAKAAFESTKETSE